MPPLDPGIRLPDPPRMSAPPLRSTRHLVLSTPSPPPISNASSATSAPLDGQVTTAVTAARGGRAHVRRPRNPFILFRCDFVKRNLVPASVERDHRNVSSIAGARWQQMSDEEKQPWKDLAVKEKIRHALEYPGYRYKPAGRAPGQSRKPRPKRGTDNDPEKVRCREIARLIGDGVVGEKLKEVLSDVHATQQGPHPAAMARRRSSSCPPLSFPRQFGHTPLHPPSSTLLSTADPSFFQQESSYINSPWEIDSSHYMPEQWQASATSAFLAPQISSGQNSAFVSSQISQLSSSVTSTPYLYDGMTLPPTPVPDIPHFDSAYLYTPTLNQEFRPESPSFPPQQSAGIFIANTIDGPSCIMPTATCSSTSFSTSLDEQPWRCDVTGNIALLSPLAVLPPASSSTWPIEYSSHPEFVNPFAVTAARAGTL